MSPRTGTLGLQVRLMSVSIRRDHVPSRNQQTKHTEQQIAQHRAFDPDDEKRTSDDCFRNQWVIFPRREFTHRPVGFKIFEQCSWHEELEKTKPHSKPSPSTPQGKHHARWHVFHDVSRNDSINRTQFVTTVQEELPCTSLRPLFRGRVRDKHMMALSISTGSSMPRLEKEEARNFHVQLA